MPRIKLVPVLMGSINIIKPLAAIESNSIDYSEYQIFLQNIQSNLGLLGVKQECYLCAIQAL